MKKYIFYFIVIFSFGFTLLDNNEKQVNTYTKSYQREPVIARNNSNGNFIIVWTSNEQDGDGEGVFAQRFDKDGNKLGQEFQVNTEWKYDQNKPAVAMNSKGNFVITWSSTKPDQDLQDIYCQIYDSEGKKIGGEILVNTTTIKSQNCPDIGMDSQGNFVIVWHSWDEDGGDRGVYAQRFKYDGTKIGGQFLVNTFTKFSQCMPTIAMNPDGKFIIAWQSWGQDDTTTTYYVDYGIYAQMFNEDGTKKGKEIHVNTTTDDDQFYPDVAIDDIGNFIITWTSWVSNTYNYSEVMAQRFDKDGNKIGGEFIVNTTLTEYQWLSSVILNNDGSFVVTWGSWKQDNSREGVYLQFFNPDGSKKNKEHRVNYYTDNYQWEPRIVSVNNDEVIVVYSSWGQDGDDYGIFMRNIKSWQTPVKDLNKIENNIKLEQNYPNPFNPETTITFYLDKKENIEIIIYDINGKLIRKLTPQNISVGKNFIKWDGKNDDMKIVPSGTYFYTIKTNNKQYSKKMILLH
jgi:hypothetical protein